MSKLIFIIFFLNLLYANSQCPCSMGAAVGGLTPVGGTINTGVLREGYLRASSFYNYSFGNEHYHNDMKISISDFKSEKIVVSKKFRNQFVGALLAYGISNKLTLEAELGYFPEKFQNISEYNSPFFDVISRGFSHITFAGKYNLFYDVKSDIEYTFGGGLTIPLDFFSDTLPYNLYPSNGNYGFIVQSFLHKGFKNTNFHLILYNKYIYNFARTRDYTQGNSLQNSLFLAQGLTRNFSGIIEFRHEHYSRDNYQDKIIDDSGANILSLTPQFYFVYNELNIALYASIPIFRYYFGEQLSMKYNFGINLTYQLKIKGE